MRILVVNWLDRENPQSGGAEEHLHQVFGRLAGKEHSVTLLASGFPKCRQRAALDGIDVHRAGGRYSFSLAAPRYFSTHLADTAFDVVVEDLNKVPLFTRAWTEKPVGLLVHHLFGATAFQEASFPVAATTWLLERTIPRAFSGVPTVSVSESTKTDLLARGLDTDIEVIPNGIDLDVYTPGSVQTKTEHPTLLFLGRVKKYKRVDLLLHAVAQLKDEGLDVFFNVAGTGDAGPALEITAQQLGIADRVAFLGFVDDARKLELLRTSWVHGLTSPNEGWGISNLEAAACGTPTVSSDSPGLRDSVLDGETGLLAPHGDVSALAAAIRSIMTDHERRARMGQRARIFAQSFSWDASADAMEGFLERVVADSRPG